MMGHWGLVIMQSINFEHCELWLECTVDIVQFLQALHHPVGYEDKMSQNENSIYRIQLTDL